mgnify:CR=1 FL=1
MADINLDAFTEDQKAVLIDLIDTKAGEKAKELLDEAKVNSDDLNLSKDELVWKKDSKRLQNRWYLEKRRLYSRHQGKSFS